MGLINDVLDLSKIEAGQLTLSLADYSMKDVVAERLQRGRIAGAREEDSRSRSSLRPTCRRARGDERQLTQVLLNLVGNAIKFTDAGEVAIKARLPTARSRFRCATPGPGIAEADQAKIFQEFQQADNLDHPQRRAALGWGSRSPSASSSCTAGASGSSRARVKGRPSHSRFPSTVERQTRPA